MKVKKATDLFTNIIKNLYSAEIQLEKALPRLVKNATDQKLAKGMEAHISVTRKQRERLEQVADMLGFSPRGKKCIAMEGLLDELRADLEEIPEGELMDPELIIGAQKIEHYEIAAYGSACALAKLMDNEKVLNLLHTTLEEEKQQDLRLTQLAEESINQRALQMQ
jgi:ferritin-like metal-binding protein YciE